MSERKVIDRKEDDFGILEKVVYGNSPEAVWVRVGDYKEALRTPIACKACRKFLMNIDNSYFNTWGVCCDCYVNYLEGRELNLKNNEERVEHCRVRHLEKNKQNENV